MLLLVFISTAVSAYVLALLAPKIGLVALPGEHRKHQQATPLVGGVAIFVGILVAYVLVDNSQLGLLPSLALLCLVGVIDDRFKLPSWVRFVAQAMAAYLMIKFTGVQLTSLGSLVSENETLLGSWAGPMTVFAVIGVINAINMSDGLDGLAGSLVILVLLAILSFDSKLQGFVLQVIVAILGFLIWNIRIARDYAKLFMGDAGSTVLGMIMAYCLIYLSQAPSSAIQPVTALWLLALPLIDAVAVLLVRPLRGSSPFSADEMHYHHLLRARGFSVNNILALVLIVQTVLIVAGLAMMVGSVKEIYQLCAFLLCFAIYLSILLISKPPD